MEYYHRMIPLVAIVTPDNFPHKTMIYYQLGESYFRYHDYHRAKFCLLESISCAEDPGDPRHSAHNSSRNTLGLYYQLINQLDSALYWFRSILESPECVPIWEAIAKANIGKAYHLQNKDDEAIPLLEFGRKKVIEIENVRLHNCPWTNS